MPHIAETYALQCALRLSEPYIPIKYFPINIDKYICICVSSGMESKNFDYWDEVVGLVKPILDKEGVQIVQIGLQNDAKLHGIVDLTGKTNFGQVNYIIKNCLLYLGNDSYGTHIAGWFKRPLVSLYAVNYKELSQPYWRNDSKTVLIESDRGGLKPSFSAQESPKTINFIKPELIAQSALNLLNLEPWVKLETIYIGSQYKQTVLSAVPDQIIAPNFFTGHLECRLDWGGTEDNLFQQVARAKCHIFTNKSLNIDVLRQLKANIVAITYVMDKENSLEFVKNIRTLGIPYGLLTEKTGEALNNEKLKYMEYGILQSETKKSLDSIKNFARISTETFFRTNKLVLAHEKIYPSKVHWQRDLPCAGLNNTEAKIIMDDPEFWNETEFQWIYNKL